MTTLRDIGEDALIQRLISLVPRSPNPSEGPGDDCAVIDPGPHADSLTLLKTDALVAHVHFLPDAPARKVGWKAAARVVSDFAAMGGRPERFLITLALPAETAVSWVEDLYRGLGDCLLQFNSTLAGGETSSVPPGSAAVISIAATGTVLRQHLVLRSGGQPGDFLFVSGELGGSIHGKHLDFTPRIEQTNWLVSNFSPTAMMDLSDGLGKDLPRLADASKCGFQLDETRIPCTPGSDLRAAIGDGEDFEILFAMSPAQADALEQAWCLRFPDLPLSRIGQLTATQATSDNFLTGGWDHFAR
jgi:thiamine-monophosphate kinase